MHTPKVSVVIPAYNGRKYLGEAIQSVCDQTFQDFEVIVVDDASPESVVDVVKNSSDPRIRYIRHENNKGAVTARKTGVFAARGEIIAFLDQDDLFHREKLEAHVRYFAEHPEIGMTYNPRLEVQGEDRVVCGMHQPPQSITLRDWVLGFPVSPSDVVLRRNWALREEIWDDSFASQAEHVIFNGQEIVFGGRLALAGCEFGNVGRALNYRRHHPCRVQHHLAARCEAELACQKIVFEDPRCPSDIVEIRDLAASNIYIMWAYVAFLQEEFPLAQDFLREAVRLEPTLLRGEPCNLTNIWVIWSSMGISDYARGYDTILNLFFANLPAELHYLEKQHDVALMRGYMLKGLHTMLWAQPEEAQSLIGEAKRLGAVVDDWVIQQFVGELLMYESEFGVTSSRKVLDHLTDSFDSLGMRDGAEKLKGYYALNRAFQNYHHGVYDRVPGDVVKAYASNARHLANKGILSMLLHSLWYSGFGTRKKSN